MAGPVSMGALDALLGAEKSGNFYVAVFIPSKQRDGAPLDHDYWRREAVRAMSSLFGGATSIRGYGGWLDEEQGSQVKEEEISIVCSFLEEEAWDEETVLALKDFLYRMGRDAKQGAIGLYVFGKYLEIRSSRYER